MSAKARVECTEISLEEARELPPIFSTFETNTVYRLRSEHNRERMAWSLVEEAVPTSFRKRYDSGRVDDWIESYLEVVPRESLRIIAAREDSAVCGLMTWQKVEWNDTLWLIDIRTRKDRRRNGVGGSMLRHLKGEARTLRVRGIAVETQINNVPAVRFYRKHGFSVSGFNDHLYTNRDLEKQDVALFLFWETG